LNYAAKKANQTVEEKETVKVFLLLFPGLEPAALLTTKVKGMAQAELPT
jgi:hypothetical protein